MSRSVRLTRKRFQEDRQGRTFADMLDDPEQPFDDVLAFFNDSARQRRMEEAEIHHDRPALSGVIREFEAQPAIDQFLGFKDPRRTKRLRQVVGVVVRIIMAQRGWKKTGKVLLVTEAAERGSVVQNVAANLTQLCFDYLDAPPVVIGSRNWITPAAELEESFFPQKEWLLDAIHERILPLRGHQPTTRQTLGELERRNRLGI